ncbi:MAG: hypothetical protein ABSE16_17940 [Verrucomicrobiota bacterium]|jgi:hypothetical protein
MAICQPASRGVVEMVEKIRFDGAHFRGRLVPSESGTREVADSHAGLAINALRIEAIRAPPAGRFVGGGVELRPLSVVP